jgi:hypothetical protein
VNVKDIEVARKLVELGFRGDGEPMTKDEFDKKRLAQIPLRDTAPKHQLCSKDIEVTGNPFLEALAEREEPNRFGQLSVIMNTNLCFVFSDAFALTVSFCACKKSIIFIRMRNSKGHEISGYIDYANRLETEDFRPIFRGKKPLVPKSADLSFYNWKTRTMSVNSTLNYQVLTTDIHGLVFKNKRDRKHIRVDPRVLTFDFCERKGKRCSN